MSWSMTPNGPNSAVSGIRAKEGTGASASAAVTAPAGFSAFIYGWTYQTCNGATITLTYQDADGTDVMRTWVPTSDTFQIADGFALPIEAGGTGGVTLSGGAAGSKLTTLYWLVANAAISLT